MTTIKVDDKKLIIIKVTIKVDGNKSVQISEYGEHNNFAWVDQEQIFSKQN